MVLDLKNITANEYSGALPMSDAEFVDHQRPKVFQAVSLNVSFPNVSRNLSWIFKD